MHQLQHHLLIKQGASLVIIIFDKTELSYVQWIEKKTKEKRLKPSLFSNHFTDWPKEDLEELFKRIRQALPLDDPQKFTSETGVLHWPTVCSLTSFKVKSFTKIYFPVDLLQQILSRRM